MSLRLTISISPQENAGNMSWRLPFLRMLSRYLDCSVLALRYTCCTCALVHRAVRCFPRMIRMQCYSLLNQRHTSDQHCCGADQLPGVWPERGQAQRVWPAAGRAGSAGLLAPRPHRHRQVMAIKPGRACEHLAFLSVPAQSGNASRCSRTRCIIIPVLRAEAALLFLDGR